MLAPEQAHSDGWGPDSVQDLLRDLVLWDPLPRQEAQPLQGTHSEDRFNRERYAESIFYTNCFYELYYYLHCSIL